MLALIIEKVSGLTYREFLKQNIFSPLSMIGSDVLDQTKPKIKNRALGYKRMRLPRSPRRPRNDDENENFEIFDYDPLNYIVGDEGVYSSINDMAKWSRAWDEEILVSRKIWLKRRLRHFWETGILVKQDLAGCLEIF